MNILKNYKLSDGKGYEEYPAIVVRYKDTEVFADLPVCAVPFGVEFTEPVLLSVNQRGIASVAEKEGLIMRLKKETQKVFFTLDADSNPVISKEETKIYTRLPKADNPEQYVYDYRNGQIFIIEVTSKE